MISTGSTGRDHYCGTRSDRSIAATYGRFAGATSGAVPVREDSNSVAPGEYHLRDDTA